MIREWVRGALRDKLGLVDYRRVLRSVEEPATGRFRMICDSDLRGDAAGAVVAAGGRLRQLSLDRPSLDTIYTRYFQNAQEVRNAA